MALRTRLLMLPAMVCLLACAGGVSWASTNELKIPGPEEVRAALHKGVEFLLQDQNKDGSWGTAEQTKDLNIFAPVPGAHHAFRAAITAMCIEALLETGADSRPEVRRSLERAEAWLFENLPKVRRATGDAIYNVWTHAYGIQALVELHRRTNDKARHRKIENLIHGQIDMLRRYESVDGGWGYYDFRVGAQRPASSSTSFVTATVLIAFNEARNIGIEIPADLVKRGVDSLERQQKKDFSYAYGEYLKLRPMMEINRPAGSLGRSQACNLALRFWGATNITDSVMTEWLDRFIARNDWLSIGRKRPIPHESWFLIAGYFFYYGHYHAALCATELPLEKTQRHRNGIAAILLPLQEKDGSWWDFPFYNYHQQYGTAYALMTLSRCLPPK